MDGFITITVAWTKGSVPRDAGTRMFVFDGGQDGTIGGGALEWEATRIARHMLATGGGDMERSFPLGPDLGQCCGGHVTLTFQRNQHDNRPVLAAPLWIWGAGHVGRAIAALMAPLRDRDITLIDIAQDRFPDPLDPSVMPLVAADPVRAVAHAPARADHLVVTYSHDIDLALCDALLRHGFATCGLIGSATKWARFRARLASMGHSDAQITRIACPIGSPTLGKHPQAIAVGVAGTLLSGASVGVQGDTIE